MIAPFLTSLDCPKALTQNCNKQTQKLTKTRCISYYIFPLYFRPKQSYATLRLSAFASLAIRTSLGYQEFFFYV